MLKRGVEAGGRSVWVVSICIWSSRLWNQILKIILDKYIATLEWTKNEMKIQLDKYLDFWRKQYQPFAF